MLIATAHQRRSGRRAERSVRIRIGESHPSHRDAVDVGRRNVFATVSADVSIAHVVREDNKDVGLGGRRVRGLQRGQRQVQQGKECNGLFHGVGGIGCGLGK